MNIDFVIALPAGRINALRDALGPSQAPWFREGGVSEKQWRDVVSVLRISGDTMDDAYLTSWATRLDIGGLLQAARDARSSELPSR